MKRLSFHPDAQIDVDHDEFTCRYAGRCGFVTEDPDEITAHVRWDHQTPRTVVDGWVMSFDSADAARLVGMPDDELAAYETWLEPETAA